MGGMMGAMLGAMIVGDQINSLIRILFVFDLSFTLITLYMLEASIVRKREGVLLRFFRNPLLLCLSLSILFFGMNSSGSFIIKDSTGEIANHQNHNVNLSSQPENSTINITANDFSYLPNQIKVEKNQMVTIKLINEGDVEHDLQLNGLNAEIMQMDSHQHGNNQGVHIHAQGGEQSMITFKPLETGEFEYYCTIPGHKESGMVGMISIL